MQASRLARLALVLSLVAATGSSLAQDSKPARKQSREHGDLNKQFNDPNLNAENFVKRFETESREIYAAREAILKAAAIQPGTSVADIGAGTGLFTLAFAKQVGPEGRVHAVDIAPAFLKLIDDRAKAAGVDRIVKTVKNSQDSVELPAGSIDVAFICDTHHHFDHPEKMLATIHKALKPGGRLIMIDFDLTDKSSDFIKSHARAPKEVYFKELADAGFAPVAIANAPKIPGHFHAEFRRVEPKSEAKTTK